MGEVKIMSVNCQGLGDLGKRLDIFKYLKDMSYSIYCLQDTHFVETQEKNIHSQWGFACFCSSYRSNSRGVAIMINNNFEHNVHGSVKDRNGNYLMLDITIEGERITLVNIYGPNEDSPVFF